MGMEKAKAGETESMRGKIDGAKKRLVIFGEKMRKLPGSTWQTICKVGRDDPRRVIHALKVGISLTFVSLLYLMEPLFKGFGQSAIWAVMTVVVVLEFTAGATLCKGLNRGLGTMLAGSLAFGIEYVAEESGLVLRAILIGAAVFIIGFASTYSRFVPYIKKNYDYGVVIFLLTFNLITVSSYRVDEVVKVAAARFYTIAIGCGICLLMSLLFFPNWSGEELHSSSVSKLEGLAKSIEACVKEYFSEEGEEETKDRKSSEDPIYKGYKAVLDSKSTDETLALYASWEPRHSRHCRFPGQQYVELGCALRHLGYTVVALHGCLLTEIQTPRTVRALFKDPCIRLSSEVSKALMELAEGIRSRRQCSPGLLSDHLHQSLSDLNAALKSQPRLFLSPNTANQSTNKILAAATTAPQQKPEKQLLSPSSKLPSFKTNSSEQAKENWRKVLRPTLSKIARSRLEFSEALPFAGFASLLVETVARLDLVIEEVQELGRVARFKEFRDGVGHVVVGVKNCEGRSKVEKNAGNLNHLPSNGTD